MKHFAAVLLLSLILAGCGSDEVEKDKKYDEAEFEQDVEQLKSKGEITDEEVEALKREVEEARREGENLADRTYSDLLEATKVGDEETGDLRKAERVGSGKLAKAEKVEREQLTAEEQRMLKTKAEKFSSHIVVSLLSKAKNEKFNEDVITSTYEVKNISDKTIKSVYGTMYHYKPNGDLLVKIPVSTEKPIQSGDLYNWSIDVDFSGSNQNHIEYVNLGTGGFNSLWVGDKIVYADGSILE